MLRRKSEELPAVFDATPKLTEYCLAQHFHSFSVFEAEKFSMIIYVILLVLRTDVSFLSGPVISREVPSQKTGHSQTHSAKRAESFQVDI